MFCMFLALTSSACSTGGTVYAPVYDAATIEAIPRNGIYKVVHGDTLYSIAWRFGIDYRSLANRNHLSSPYTIHTGQIIYLRGRAPVITSTIVKPVETKIIEREPTTRVVNWQWPARGTISGEFSNLNKGININGYMGQPIYATAAGKVVYSGNGLRGYGNLIIIKHNSTYLSAYAHNSVVYVKAGDWVRSGQKIAEMGKTDSQRINLHFEIRRDGKPVNPLDYLGR
jgi:lipoprotein NlpD